jgi:hypothetical protein
MLVGGEWRTSMLKAPDLTPPKKELTDYARDSAKTLIATVIPKPHTALAIQFFELVWPSALEGRRGEWMEDVGWLLTDLHERFNDFKPEKLAENESFVSALIQATRIATSTHLHEKREWLRNALLNIATGNMVDETKQQIFLNTIEAYTPAHVRVLHLMWKPSINWGTRGLGQRQYIDAVEIAVPELKGQEPLVRAIFTEVTNRGFSNLGRPDQPFPATSIAITNLGVEFLRFILEVPPIKK